MTALLLAVVAEAGEVGEVVEVHAHKSLLLFLLPPNRTLLTSPIQGNCCFLSCTGFICMMLVNWYDACTVCVWPCELNDSI